MNDLTEIEKTIKAQIAKELQLVAEEIDIDVIFQVLGLDSVNSMFLLDILEEKYGIEIQPIQLVQNPTVRSFSVYLKGLIDES